ncbi:DUF222 domain-containing protein [Nocardia sp. CA-145437]|uniref:HNH endonuclease signature motif containing protein n=1 Tax=Nocardia sp. CA-145437 TaxID=3239980 RepID=UPI003D9772B1
MDSNGVTLDDCGIAELAAAVATLTGSVQGGKMVEFSDEDVVSLMRQLETCKRQLAALDTPLIIEAGERSLHSRSGAGKMVPFLRHTLGLSRYDASVRVKVTHHCGEFVQQTGHVAPPVLPMAAEAFAAGEISRDHVRHIMDVMNHLPLDVPAEARAEAEQILVDYSRNGWPDDLLKIGRDILARLDPDGKVVSDADRRRRRGITLCRPGVDGMTRIEGWITPELRALLDAAFAKLARPGMCNLEDAESPTARDGFIENAVLDAAAGRDRRDAGQRTHDALFALLQPGVDVSDLGSHRGMPVQVVFTMSLSDFENGTGVATTASGTQVSVAEAMKMAADSHPVIAVLDGDGMPLYLQRSRRTASEAQRLALLARDKGCTRPGCEQPASMCAAHHITDWAKGGPTDIDNLAFACDHCHALINDGPDGWKTVVMGKDSPYAGRTGWIAPKSVDPTGTPRVNDRHHVGQVIAAAVDSSCRQWRSRVSSKPSRSCLTGVRKATRGVVTSPALPDWG